ncbi:MAG TPA: HAMP domain-containing sensor histidine kinase [Xanthobacteraceae bacterium]|nr:HAMP domain-containing sensor histidine kinase [Xanthobacteraceae bacterium]
MTSLGIEGLIRRLPIRWRIFLIAALNTAVAVILAALIWDGAKSLSTAWTDVRQVRDSDRLLALLESEAGRLQNLIHRYFNQPNPEVFAEITLLREALLTTLRNRASVDPMLAGSVEGLVEATEKFLAGFGDLRATQSRIARTYENEVLKPARDMAGLYAIIDGASGSREALIWPSLSKSREAFSATVVAANAYYLSLASSAADDANKNLETIERTIPVMLDLADNDLQRAALAKLREHAQILRQGMNNLTINFTSQARLLRDAIDGNQGAMATAIDQLSAEMRLRERLAQERFDRTLAGVYKKVAIVALVFLTLIVIVGVAITRSISSPLRELMAAMHAIVAGFYESRLRGLKARDEIGDMARAVEVFRENAIAKRQAEEELRASKERAEQALTELRNTQESLIEAEKLAALGGLVAGVAHEVNNPVGISMTVASSLARRCESFGAELDQGQMRRSRLVEFIEGNREAANQLVANLQRAGELIQSFKQVAVDRSHAERRQFDLRQSTEQILASLRPGLKKSHIDLVTEIPEGIVMDSYPGHYGQVLTNLFLNAVKHGFDGVPEGTIHIEARPIGNQVEINFYDDGKGMTEEVQRRAFDPFFTTRRSEGGTGLGLHIVYNLVTRRLGGRIMVSSAPWRGTTFRITLPLSAPRQEPEAAKAVV